MDKRIESYIKNIEDQNLQEATRKYIEHHWDKLSTVPASIKFHHTYTGGLLDHVIEIIELGLTTRRNYNLEDKVNYDYYVVSALIHDIAKVDRYEWNSEKEEWGYSDKASGTDPNVIIVGRGDHSIYPLIDFPLVTGVPLPSDVAIAVLGHMGGFSVTSVKPDTLMDVLLSTSDHISSRLCRHGEPKSMIVRREQR